MVPTTADLKVGTTPAGTHALISDAHATAAVMSRYAFLVDTCRTERLEILSVWSRPRPT